jgi:hypothetical protein
MEKGTQLQQVNLRAGLQGKKTKLSPKRHLALVSEQVFVQQVFSQ